MLWLLFLAELSAPAPTRELFTYRDVPVDYIEEDKPVPVAFRLTVDPNGRIVDCETDRAEKDACSQSSVVPS